MQLDFRTVDVFTDRRFGGNPLAVVTDARGLTTEQMQSIAAEFNLAETTFVLPPKRRSVKTSTVLKSSCIFLSLHWCWGKFPVSEPTVAMPGVPMTVSHGFNSGV